MVHALEQEQESYMERIFQFRGLNGDHSGNNGVVPNHGHTQSMIIESTSSEDLGEDRISKSQVSSKTSDRMSEKQQIGAILNKTDKAPRSRLPSSGTAASTKDKDMETMKEKFAKLLLGEDMSGGGKGVSSSLALSNAITNLAASVFGEMRKLEPMSPENKVRWKKEIDWLLSVTDYIVEMVPMLQKSKDGTCMEIMTTKQRTDLQMNIPALRKLDTMLIDCLDNFTHQNEFYYVSQDADEAEKGSKRSDEKWWLPTVKVPPEGLSEVTKKWIQFQKDSVNQVLKAAMAINAQVLSEIEIPESYIESLPKNGRSSLGDSIYKGITVEYFDPDNFLTGMDMSSEHKILDLKNRIEASIIIWKRKMTSKDAKSPWGSAVSLEKREAFEERAETVLLLLKHRFPGLPQSSLEISKIQYNKDVGHAILESYSRILESLAHRVLSQIEDLFYADSLAQNPSLAQHERKLSSVEISKFPNVDEEIEKLKASGTPTSMTLSDFMGWSVEHGGENNNGNQTKNGSEESLENPVAEDQKGKFRIEIPEKIMYLEKLENSGGLRSPTARH